MTDEGFTRLAMTATQNPAASPASTTRHRLNPTVSWLNLFVLTFKILTRNLGYE